MAIALIGDSILDNFFWLKDRKRDLKFSLEELGYPTYNFAVDESQLEDIIYGIEPNKIYKEARSYPYPVDGSGKVHPFTLLSSVTCNLAVISVGGNDLRVNLTKLIYGVDSFVGSIFNSKYLDDLNHVIRATKLHIFGSRVILVCLYCPYLGRGSRYKMLGSVKDELISRIQDFYMNIGYKHNIPILDLSRTFNPYDRTHYGSTEIEPSNFSSYVIAKCIEHIEKNYRGFGIYYAPNCDITQISRI